MKLQVSNSGKATQLSYELPHRVHDAKIYPVQAPNGSTVILYVHENGVRILWRGGRPIKHVAPPKEQPKSAKVNGTSKDAVMIIDSDDEELLRKAASQAPLAETEFESEDEELDPEAPYPSFIQQIDLPLNVEVLQIAVPKIPPVTPIRPAESMPEIFSTKIVFAVTCADYGIRIITLPLCPPSHATKSAPASKIRSRWGEQTIDIMNGHQSIPTGISMTWTSTSHKGLVDEWAEDMDMGGLEGEESNSRARSSRRSRTRSRSGPRDDSEKWSLMIASHSGERGGVLRVWRFLIAALEISVKPPVIPYRTEYLTSPAKRISFSSAQYPKRRHSQLLVVDPKGTVSVYDPLALSQKKAQSSRREDKENGAWLSSFNTSFEVPKNYSTTVPALAHRKRILDASWASDGRSIVALLADGEWGIWDVDRSGPKPPPDPSTFSLRNFLGTTTHSSTPSALKSRNARSSLAPMTPNTRRTREESLFQGSTSSQPGIPGGGITIEALHSTTGGAPEESVVIWYGSDTYRIPNFGQFWSRNALGTGGGSLFGPGLVRVQGLSLLGEAIATIEQFDITAKAARMAIPRDVLVVAEHRLILQTSTTAPMGSGLGSIISDRARDEQELTIKNDQSKLSHRELDVGGMDRLLDSMEFDAPRGGSGGLVLGNPRKVLFAS